MFYMQPRQAERLGTHVLMNQCYLIIWESGQFTLTIESVWPVDLMKSLSSHMQFLGFDALNHFKGMIWFNCLSKFHTVPSLIDVTER